MATRPWLLLLLLLLAAAAPPCYVGAAAAGTPTTLNTYIVQMSRSELPASFEHHLEWYASTVGSVAEASDSADPGRRLIYTYDTAFHGFAARLSEAEAGRLEGRHGVVAVFLETVYRLHTARSPEFLGLQSGAFAGVWSSAPAKDDVIVGVVDSAVWPESPSFSDTGMGPVPARWKGACDGGEGFPRWMCNRKVIGVRTFSRGYEATIGHVKVKSARDVEGHGSHTASTAAGSAVRGASMLGYAAGTARGMAPEARLAIYKVCWSEYCVGSDILSAVDRAVADGVDVLSISLVNINARPYWQDKLAVAAFGAMEKGVFVACAAGNDGPAASSVQNLSPWITTVGASTVDRDFPASVKLGDGRNVTGLSLYGGRRSLSTRRQYPLVYLAGNGSADDDATKSQCLEGALKPDDVAGKIVLCEVGSDSRVKKGDVVKQAGGLGMILANKRISADELMADSHLLPAVNVRTADGEAIKEYVKGSPRPTATLAFAGTKLGVRPSPVVAVFSSRGPNIITPEILKPDVVGPGVNILAAWSGAASPTDMPDDRRRLPFTIISGTSMSCPHVAGVAALLRARSPDWSPAAIRSALMTTASVHDNTLHPLKDAATGAAATHYAHGAGHIDPPKALDPGLVYDLGRQDYINFLCTLKLTPDQLKIFTWSSNDSCRQALASRGDLNYPAISASLSAASSWVTVHRTVTNVGAPVSTYHVRVSPFEGAAVVVEPSTLHFTREKQKIQYSVTFVAKSPRQSASPEFGDLIWKDETHMVRSPVVLTYPSTV